jgi:hypothetical protein
MNKLTRRFSISVLVLSTIAILGCPLGRKNRELGEECSSANDCPMGTTGLMCADPSSGKSFCTKACTGDADCAGAKNGTMTCISGKCAFPAKVK